MLSVQVSVNQLDKVWGVNAAGEVYHRDDEVFYRKEGARWYRIRSDVVMSSVSAGPLPSKNDVF